MLPKKSDTRMTTASTPPVKKKRNQRPTLRQQRVAKKVSEVLRSKKASKDLTMGKILREVGYSETTANSPSLVTNRPSYQEFFSQLIPDEKLREVHEQLLNAVELDNYTMDAKLTDKDITEIVEKIKGCTVRKIVRVKGNKTATVYFYRPDNQTRDKALEKGYRVKGHFAQEKSDTGTKVAIVNVINYGKSER